MRLTLWLRASISFIAGLVITFAQAHNTQVGLYTLAGFGLSLGVALTAVSIWLKLLEVLPLGLFNLMFGSLALLVPTDSRAGYVWLVCSFAAVTAVTEIYLASRNGFATQMGKEQLLSAVLAGLLASVFIFSSPDEISSVGFFGAYLVLSAVHLGISASSVRAG